MGMKIPKPRSSNFMGMRREAHVSEDGSWLEPEEMCYPHGRAYSRRAYAHCPDGKLRVVECGLPDTWFSIPGRLKLRGAWVEGFLSFDDGKLEFNTYNRCAHMFVTPAQPEASPCAIE